MKNTLNRITAVILTVITVFSFAVIALPSQIAASDTVTTTVNIATADRNMSGPGYYWANRFDTLTLTNLNLDTDEDFGLRLPNNCTVILEGKNYIKAGKYGISCSGNVVFKGNGSLTIDAGEIGIYLVTQDSTQKIRLITGDYTVTAGKYGVYSEAADFSFVDGTMSINMIGDSSYAILGRCVNLLGGKFSANASVETTQELVVDGIDIKIESSNPALASKNLKVKNISAEYNGENTINASSTASKSRSSIIFGDSIPGFVDYILLAVFALGIAAAVFIPSLRRKKKAEALYKRLADEGYDIRR
ncbi:MAG: hypothetical protein E7672_04240 [Ruminococcaceae bacterium]|nr:hypothetical protein [Oscillospiraceae bacterium]